MAKSGYGEKVVLRESGITTLRYRDPTNEHTADQAMQFRADYSTQKAYLPNRIKGVLVQHTHYAGDAMPTRAMNKSGRTCALGPIANSEFGSSPDDKGTF